MATTTTTVVAARNNNNNTDTTTTSLALAKAVAQERHHRTVMRALETGWRCLMIEVAHGDNGASSRDDAMLMGHMMLRKVAFVVLAALPRTSAYKHMSAETRAVVRLFGSPLLAEAEQAVSRQLVASADRMQRVYARNGPLVRAAARATEAEFAQLVAAVRQRTVLAKALSPAQAEVPHMMIKAATCSDAAMAYVADVLVPRAAAVLGADETEMRPMVEAVEALRAALARVDAAEF